jgi:hypothetical protein
MIHELPCSHSRLESCLRTGESEHKQKRERRVHAIKCPDDLLDHPDASFQNLLSFSLTQLKRVRLA